MTIFKYNFKFVSSQKVVGVRVGNASINDITDMATKALAWVNSSAHNSVSVYVYPGIKTCALNANAVLFLGDMAQDEHDAVIAQAAQEAVDLRPWTQQDVDDMHTRIVAKAIQAAYDDAIADAAWAKATAK